MTDRFERTARPAVFRKATTIVMVVLIVAITAFITRAEFEGPSSRTTRESVPSSSSTSTTTTTTVPSLPVTPITWSPCADGLQCGTVTAPLNYADPDGPTIPIAVARHPAEDPAERIGSLVINPGGPGTSGINDLPNELRALTPGLLERFDIVSYDPRGVQRTSPVNCSASSTPANATPLERPDPVPSGPNASATEQALLANDRAFAAQCEAESGNILPYVGTLESAEDLDRIRQALGDSQLTFMGQSYGTLLGATYAELFPTRVRAMVLDSALDPAESTDQMLEEQADSFEADLNAFFTWCASNSSCPWRPAGNPVTALLALITESSVNALPAGGNAVAGPGEIYDALLAGLDASGDWPTLGDALGEAAAKNGSGVLTMTDNYAGGGSTNGGEAEQAIDCLDHPVSRNPGTYPALAASAAVSAPVFGPLLAWGWLGCAVWPVLPTRTPAPAVAPGSPPILVTGTTGDPATPYQWSVNLAKELQHGELVTWQGQSHVAYFYSPCVRAIDEAYLINGILPPVGTVCSD
jgi:pimeloyl-ACP methyl ester carboxylesterase